MSVETEIQGSPTSIESAATWLKDELAVACGDAGDRFNSARSNASASWNSVAGDQFSSSMKRGRDALDDLEGAAKKMGQDLGDFAEKLRICQDDMTTIRSDARGAGLTVAGFTVQDPGPGPARPPDDFTGTPAEVEAHNADVRAYDAHQDLIEAYDRADSEAARIDRKYATACRELGDEYSVGQHAAWLLTTTEILGDTAAGAIGASLTLKQSALHTRAQALVTEARRAVDDLQTHPERYVKRRWLFFKQIDAAKLEADRLAVAGKLDEAEDLVRQSRALGESRLPKFLGRAGKVLGPLGIGLGIYNDYQEGETTTQIAVSQGASAALGIGSAALAGAGIGAAVGSVVPVAGTAVGAVVGTAIGAGVAIFSDGAIDSFFENGPDVGKAAEEGLDALEDTGGAIADAAGGVADTVGGWFD